MNPTELIAMQWGTGRVVRGADFNHVYGLMSGNEQGLHDFGYHLGWEMGNTVDRRHHATALDTLMTQEPPIPESQRRTVLVGVQLGLDDAGKSLRLVEGAV